MMNVLLVRVENRIEDVFEVEDMTIGELIVEIFDKMQYQYPSPILYSLEFVYLEDINYETVLEYVECLEEERDKLDPLKYFLVSALHTRCAKEILPLNVRHVISLMLVAEERYRIAVSVNLKELSGWYLQSIRKYGIEEAVIRVIGYNKEKEAIEIYREEPEHGIIEWKAEKSTPVREFIEKVRTVEDLIELLRSVS